MSLLPVGVIPSGGYDINNSLRFRRSASAYLSRTFASAGNRTTWTWSAWVKRGLIGNDFQYLFDSNPSGTQEHALRFNANDTFQFVINNGGTDIVSLVTSQVFRDISSWYHFVVIYDSTQATSSNRIQIYCNGSIITSFTTATYPSLNLTGYINSASVHAIGRYQAGAARYFDGYMAEVNFVANQALTASSFGETNVATGVWQPKKYTGTYGINGFYLPFSDTNSNIQNLFTYSEDLTNAAWTKQNVTVTGDSVAAPNGSTTADTIFETVTNGEHFTDRNLTPTTNTQYVFSSYVKYLNRRYFGLRVVYINGSQDTLVRFDLLNGVYHSTVGTAATAYSITSVGSGWYRISVTYTTPATNPAATLVFRHQLLNDSLAATYAGNTSVGTYVWGSQLESNGILGAYVATTASAQALVNSIGTDRSLGSTVFGYNSWIPNNISLTAGVTYDAMTDSPTPTSPTVCNYPTFNSVNPALAGVTLTWGNLRFTNSDTVNGQFAYSTFGTNINTGTIIAPDRYYFEATDTLTGTGGVASAELVGIGNSAYRRNGQKADLTAYGASYTTGDVIGVAVDRIAGTITYYKNNVSQGAQTGLNYLGNPRVYGYSGNIWDINFGQRPFIYTPPSGFNRLNTYNLPDSTVKKGNKYMDATLYTGNGSTQTITNAGAFKPDFVWTKSRNRTTVSDHIWNDSTRPIGANIYSNLTNAEDINATARVTSFNSNGYSIGNGVSLNAAGDTYVGWQWQAGQGSTSSNTSGSITSTVSVNTTAGFSIVTYTGTGANATVGHGLGVAPKFIIIKNRSTSVDWRGYHASIGATAAFGLNLTATPDTNIAYFNNTNPTSSVFSLGNGLSVNGSGNSIVAYCWAEITGFSRFGSYTGNGNADGPFVYCGFRPKFVLAKNTATTSNWGIVDSSRSPSNVADKILYPNVTNAEGTGISIDLLSNGFKLRGTSLNGSTNTFIFMAFAENPFKNALAI